MHTPDTQQSAGDGERAKVKNPRTTSRSCKLIPLISTENYPLCSPGHKESVVQKLLTLQAFLVNWLCSFGVTLFHFSLHCSPQTVVTTSHSCKHAADLDWKFPETSGICIPTTFINDSAISQVFSWMYSSFSLKNSTTTTNSSIVLTHRF